MSPPYEEARRSGEATGSKTSATKPNTPNSSRTTPTQQERVRRMLSRNWICGVDFISNPPDGYAPILRYTGRIHELRKQGWLIDRRECAHPWHNHNAQMWQWKIVGHVNGGTLPLGVGE